MFNGSASSVASEERASSVAGLLDFVEDLPEQEVEELLLRKLGKATS